jgi:hypothetical protein
MAFTTSPPTYARNSHSYAIIDFIHALYNWSKITATI